MGNWPENHSDVTGLYAYLQLGPGHCASYNLSLGPKVVCGLPECKM